MFFWKNRNPSLRLILIKSLALTIILFILFILTATALRTYEKVGEYVDASNKQLEKDSKVIHRVLFGELLIGDKRVIEFRKKQLIEKLGLDQIDILLTEPSCVPFRLALLRFPIQICNISKIDTNNEVYYIYISKTLNSYRIFETLRTSVKIIAVLSLFFIISIFFVNRNLKKSILDPLVSLENSPDSWVPSGKDISKEICSLHQKIVEYIEQSNKQRQRAEEMKTQFKLGKLASQVAHDILSPLTALEMATKDLSQLPEVDRIMVRGSVSYIRDIANNLLYAYKGKNKVNNEASPQLISELMENLVSNKRIQYRHKTDISIRAVISGSAYGVFTVIDPVKLKRLLSNLINNSVESLDDCEAGIISLKLEDEGEYSKLIIEDNGKGIPDEILPMLGQKRISVGKNGHGIGFVFVREVMEEIDGKINIDSKIGKGTRISLLFPRCSPPKWFVPVLLLVPNSTIVIVDDDPMIHQVWKERFKAFDLGRFKIVVLHFTKPEALIEQDELQRDTSNIRYLVDYEFANDSRSGLDLIEQLNIQRNSFLVTSRYMDGNIKDRCETLKIGLIPKFSVVWVPIEIQHKPKIDKVTSPTYDIVFIDDNLYLREFWKQAASKKNISLLALSTTSEFQDYQKQVTPQTKFYIDSNLGENEEKGEVFAKKLYEKGYRNLYLATGYQKENFPEMPWIKEVVEKSIPFDNS